MVVLNQDRDIILSFEKGDELKSELSIYEGIPQGINILFHDTVIGTFDTIQEVVDEITNIINCEYDYYVVSGFSDYKECFVNEAYN